MRHDQLEVIGKWALRCLLVAGIIVALAHGSRSDAGLFIVLLVISNWLFD